MRFFCFVFLICSSSLAIGQSWTALNESGLTNYSKGKYEQATPLFQQALSVAEKNGGKVSEEYITSLNNYAYLQQRIGDFSNAIINFNQVCDLSRALYGKSSIEYIESLVNKANVFLTNGGYDSSEINLTNARQLVLSQAESNTAYYQKKISSFFEKLVNIQSSTASLLYHRGQLKMAIFTLEEQKRSLELAYGAEVNTSKTYFGVLGNLSVYYLENEELDKAREVLLKSIPFEKEEYGIHSAPYYESQNSLGSIYRKTHVLDSAQIIWKSAEQDINQTDMSGGKTHLGILTNLGELNIELENYSQALEYLNKSKRLHEQREGRIPRLYQVTIFNLAEAYHLIGKYAEADALYQELINSLIDNVVHEFSYLSEGEKRAFYKDQLFYINAYLAFAFEVANLLPIQDSETPYINTAIAGQLYDLQLMTKAIILNSSKKMKKHILKGNDELLKTNYRLWQEKKGVLAGLYNSGQSTIDQLIKLAAEIESLETYLSRSSRDFKEGFSIERITWQDIQRKLKPEEAAVEMIRILDGLAYLAVIITSDTKEMPVLTLTISTRSKHLEREFHNLYQNAIQYQIEDTLSYKVYWQSIRDTIVAHMPGNKMPETIYLSSDGIYSQMNLNTLLNTETHEYLIDETQIHLLTNTKEIIEDRMSVELTTRVKKAALFGDPSFSIIDTTSTKYFDRLIGTGREIMLIDKLLQERGWETKTYQQEEASVAQIKENNNMNILHLATHGFFINNEGSSIIEVLLSSGLALAGANDLSSTTKEDGILTAYETLTLELDSTELVVLSACETGKGDYHPGEGVYGLQRAIKVAGAKSIIMSLWKVDDEATQELMVNFYQNWTPGIEKRDAFRKAQQQLREKYSEPFYWGAFVMMGE